MSIRIRISCSRDGYRSGSNLDYVGFYGYYWSATPFGDATLAYCLYFSEGGFGLLNYSFRNGGYSVRLVCSVSK